MTLKDFLDGMFGRQSQSTRSIAKDRLRLVLQSDRVSLSPHVMEQIKVEIFQVLSKYLPIDEKELDFSLERNSTGMTLAASIPIRQARQDE